jgi:hypothetical protein
MDLFSVSTLAVRVLVISASSGSTARSSSGSHGSSHGHSGQTNRTSVALANGFTERLFGSIRRNCLARVIVFGKAHLAQGAARLLDVITTTRRSVAIQRTENEQFTSQS